MSESILKRSRNARFYCGCSTCGAKPSQRCVTAHGIERSNHPARNSRYAAMRDEIRGSA